MIKCNHAFTDTFLMVLTIGSALSKTDYANDSQILLCIGVNSGSC